DERNRILLGMRPVLVRGERLLIIDAGAGDAMDAKNAAIYALDRTETLDVTLARAGVSADAIEIVLASHLHFDHAGGFTSRQADGRPHAFPSDRVPGVGRTHRRLRGGPHAHHGAHR